jgi:hypothetical protein
MASFNQLAKREQVLICVVLPLMVAGGLGYMAWKKAKELGPDPQIPAFLQSPVGLWADINQTTTEIAAQQAIINRGPSVKKLLDSLQGEIRKAEERLPLEAEKTVVRQLIEDLARNIPNNIGIVQFKAVAIQEGGVVKGEDYQPITYRTEIKGDLNGLIKYVDQIEKNARFMMVRNLTIRPGGLMINGDPPQIVSNLHSINTSTIQVLVLRAESGGADGPSCDHDCAGDAILHRTSGC